ncbi:MAG: AMP-binding protein [Pseudomonadales bacterium]|nr:AMP-binding protein [Pseudomonadales bacterium]
MTETTTKTSISRYITHNAEADPDRPAITHEGKTITRRQLDLSTNRLARAYEKLGVRQDDLVTVALPNSIEFYQACIAIWKLGATPQPVSARLPKPEQEAIVELAQPSLVVGVEPGSLGDFPAVPAAYEPDPELSDDLLPDRIARHWKAPTSGGSTGRPKIIVAAGESAFDYSASLPLRQERNRAQLVPGPLYHNAPFSFSVQGLCLGNHLIVMTRFDAEETLQLIEQWQVDWMMLVPTMMLRIWKLPEETRNRYDLSSLRIVLHLAAPCPAWLKEAWIHWLGGERIHELFAGTEATGATWITGDEWLAHRGSVGKLMGAGRVKIVGEQGEELPAGQIGEIYLLPAGGPGSTYHYIGAEPKAIEGGWESLGDMGYVDEEGYIYLSDRKTDMILSGGANIYPAEVEAAIDGYEGVRSSAVIGLPDEDMGQVVHAIVDAPEGLDENQLLTYLGERLARYKIPRTIEVVNQPLRDDAGKTRRSALLQERLQTRTAG